MGYSRSAVVAGQASLFPGYLCQCFACTIPPCEDCAISKTAPHSQCYLCLWKARGRECRPGSLCHGCLKYAGDQPQYVKKAKKMFLDRKRMRQARETEEPVTFTSQDLSDNEFVDKSEDFESFSALFEQQGDSDDSSTQGIELVLALT